MWCTSLHRRWNMKKAKLTGLIGIALILSAALLIALTAFFGVFDFNRKVNEFVDTLPGNEEDIATPLPDEPETTLPDSPDTPVLPQVPPSEPSFAEAGTSDSSASGLGPAYLNGSAYVESKWAWFDYKFTDASGSSTISLSTLASRYDIAKSKGYLNFQATANVNLNDKGYEQSATANAGGTTSTASGKSGVLNGSTKTIPSSCTSITINWYVQTEDGRGVKPNRAKLIIFFLRFFKKRNLLFAIKTLTLHRNSSISSIENVIYSFGYSVIEP